MLKQIVSMFMMFLAFIIVPIITVIMGLLGRKFIIRKKIPGLEAINEGIGRAAELGGTCLGTSGGGRTETSGGPQVIAGLSLLGYVTRLAIRNNVPMYIATREADQRVLAEDVLKMAFAAEGKLDQYKPEYNLWFGRGAAYEVGYLGFLETQKVVTTFLLGRFGSEGLLFSEAGARLGCLQIGGTPNTWGAVFLIATCDYVMISDELFAAAAIVTENPIETAALVGSDMLRLLVIGLIGLGIILLNLGSTVLLDILRPG